MPAPTIEILRAIQTGLDETGYAAARRGADRNGEPAQVSAVCLLACGFTPPQVRSLFQIADRLRRYNTDRCNRIVTDREQEDTERDERLAHHIILYSITPDGPPILRPCVLAVELTGLPGGAAIKVRLRLPNGVEAAGNDFGDSRFICI